MQGSGLCTAALIHCEDFPVVLLLGTPDPYFL